VAESGIVIYAHVIEHCHAFFLLRIRETTPSDLRRFSLRENSFDAVTEKLVKFQLPDTLTVEILLHQSWGFTRLSSYNVLPCSGT
jgi:hypothetical protein